MAKFDKPNSERDVFDVMKEYCKKKNIILSDRDLMFMAENAFLFFESRAWKDTKYWPALAMRWVLTSQVKSKTSYKQRTVIEPTRTKGKTVRQRVLEQENHIGGSYEVD